MEQLTPRVTVVGHHTMPLLTCFPTNVAEHCPVLVFSAQIPPTFLTHAFLSGLHRINSARPTRVLNLMLRVADGRSDLSRQA